MNELTENNDRTVAETKEEQRILASNAWHLARYMIEHDHEIALPRNFNVGQFLLWAENYPHLADEDKIEFINQYAVLEKATKNVTARTLVATRIHGRGFWHAAFCSSAGRYLVFLSGMTLLFVILLIINIANVVPLPNVMIPFCAAGLGTSIYLLRITQTKLQSREFDPAYIPSQLIRLVLGVLAGGSLVLFPNAAESGMNLKELNQPITVGQGALAFVLGYAVDVFYAILDNLGGKIKTGPESSRS